MSSLSPALNTLLVDPALGSDVLSRQAVILLVEDDPILAQMLRERLGSRGCSVWHAASGAEAEAIGGEIRPDLVIVDLALPDVNGLVLCATLRERWTVPIIICTASQRPEDAVLGFKLGADDFVRKPFSTDELEARIEAALRRPSLQVTAAPADDSVQVVGPLVIDRARHMATVSDVEMHLTPIEFRLLSALADPPNHLHGPVSSGAHATDAFQAEGRRASLADAHVCARARISVGLGR
jgi:DNA-binding response OmpR family regulator